MAYACPVCDALASDGEHLAHHLAIVAMTRGGEHEAWLDDHAAGWRDARPEALAATATEHAEEVEHELADDSAGEHPAVGHDRGHHVGRTRPAESGPSNAGDEETAAVLAEAREITRRMLGEKEAVDGEAGVGGTEGSTETDTDE